MYVPQLSYPLVFQCTSRLLPCPSYCKQCCNEHWSTCVSFDSPSSIFAWKIPQTEEPGGLQSMRSQRVRHDWVTNTFRVGWINTGVWVSPWGGSLKQKIPAMQRKGRSRKLLKIEWQSGRYVQVSTIRRGLNIGTWDRNTTSTRVWPTWGPESSTAVCCLDTKLPLWSLSDLD